MDLLDLFFPKRCVQCKKFGSYVCATCFARIHFDEQLLCFICNRSAMQGLTHPVCKTRYSIDGIFSCLVYRGVVKRLLYVFKFQPHIIDIRGILIDLFYEGFIQSESFYRHVEKGPLVIPIPLSPAKFRSRGYNQAALLAKGMATKCSLQFLDGLKRIRHTQSQVGKDREERKRNIKGAFLLNKKAELLVKDKTIFLVDDIVTSGATLREAAGVLKHSGAKQVFGLALAHGQ